MNVFDLISRIEETRKDYLREVGYTKSILPGTCGLIYGVDKKAVELETGLEKYKTKLEREGEKAFSNSDIKDLECLEQEFRSALCERLFE